MTLLYIIRKEIVNNILSFRFVAAYVMLCVLILMAMYLMTNDFLERRQVAATEIRKEEERIEGFTRMQDANHQFQEIQRGFNGTRRPKALSILATGLDGKLPIHVSTGHQFMSSSEERDSRQLMFELIQTPDFVFVVHVVLSLLALLFVFDSVCGEKERGTLKLLLSNSVPRDTVLLGKWIGGYVTTALPFVAAAFAGFVYLRIDGAVQLTSEDTTRFLTIIALSLLYISTFFTLGLLISTLTHRSATALLVGLLVWIGWVLVIPNLAPMVARLVVVVPDRLVVEAEKRTLQQEQRLLERRHRQSRIYLNNEGLEKIKAEGERNQRVVEEYYQRKMAGQVSLTQNFARISPASSYLFAVTRLAGTGLLLAEQFNSARDRFQRGMEDYRRNVLYNRDNFDWSRGGVTAKNPDWFDPADLPRFELFRESFNNSLNAVMFDGLLLIVFNVVLFLGSYLFFLRYDIV